MCFPVLLQARMGSTRLPGKVLRDLCGEPLLGRAVTALQAAASVSEVVLTVDKASAAALSLLAEKYGCSFFAGPEEDVLGRFRGALQGLDAKHIIRATGDNPLVCPKLLDRIVAHHLESDADLSHFSGNAAGTGVEVVRTTALLEAAQEATDPFEREHVTPFIYRNQGRYRVEEPEIAAGRMLRLTVDTEEDFLRVERIFEQLYRGRPLPLSEILRALNKNPDLFR